MTENILKCNVKRELTNKRSPSVTGSRYSPAPFSDTFTRECKVHPYSNLWKNFFFFMAVSQHTWKKIQLIMCRWHCILMRLFVGGMLTKVTCERWIASSSILKIQINRLYRKKGKFICVNDVIPQRCSYSTEGEVDKNWERLYAVLCVIR